MFKSHSFISGLGTFSTLPLEFKNSSLSCFFMSFPVVLQDTTATDNCKYCIFFRCRFISSMSINQKDTFLSFKRNFIKEFREIRFKQFMTFPYFFSFFALFGSFHFVFFLRTPFEYLRKSCYQLHYQSVVLSRCL